MTAFTLFLVSIAAYAFAAIWHQWRSGAGHGVAAQVKAWSILAMIVAFLWGVARTPFWRHVFITLSVLTFASVMLPEEMKFFERHHSLVFALPFAMGFIAANHSRSGIGTLASWSVLAVLLSAAYKFALTDPTTGPWLRSGFGETFTAYNQGPRPNPPTKDPNCPGIWSTIQVRATPVRFNPEGRCGWRIEYSGGCIFVQRAHWTKDASAYGPLCPTTKGNVPRDAEWVWTADGIITARIQLWPPQP